MGNIVRNRKAAVAVADALGISHFIVANVIIALGEFTDLFSFMKTSHPGIDFVMQYLDALVYSLFGLANPSDPLMLFLSAELIVLTSSVLYGALCWAITKTLLQGFAN